MRRNGTGRHRPGGCPSLADAPQVRPHADHDLRRGSIPDGWNRKENHDKLEKQMRESIARAAAAKVPNVITFSGNRRGLPDLAGRDNCIFGLRRIKAYAEEPGVTVCVELLNSKVDHKD